MQNDETSSTGDWALAHNVFMYKFLYLLIFLTAASACSIKEKPVIQLATHRNMGIALHLQNMPDNGGNKAQLEEYFSSLASEALFLAYGAKIHILKFEENAPVQTVENLFQVGRNEIDDLFVIQVQFKGPFLIADTKKEFTETESTEDPVGTNITIYNGEQLKTVSLFKFLIPTKGEGSFHDRYLKAFKKASLEIYATPNIYPKSNPKYFADLIYLVSKKREEEGKNLLTCQNAELVLKYYAQVAELYQKVAGKNGTALPGQQEKKQELQDRLKETSEKASLLQKCDEENKQTFGIQFVDTQLDPVFQKFIEEAAKRADLGTTLQQYTTKTVRLVYELDSNNRLNLSTYLKFDLEKYLLWTRNRIPDIYKGYKILSLDPYYALMQKLIFMKKTLPAEAPLSLRAAFENMKIMLIFSTILHGDIEIVIDGTYQEDQKTIKMAYPNSVILNIPGYEKKAVFTKSNVIFQEKGWIALGNCKTLEGSLTEDGLVYNFFGLPCP